MFFRYYYYRTCRMKWMLFPLKQIERIYTMNNRKQSANSWLSATGRFIGGALYLEVLIYLILGVVALIISLFN